MKRITSTQRAALFRIEKQDKGFGVDLPKVTGEALVRRGLAIELRNGKYALP